MCALEACHVLQNPTPQENLGSCYFNTYNKKSIPKYSGWITMAHHMMLHHISSTHNPALQNLMKSFFHRLFVGSQTRLSHFEYKTFRKFQISRQGGNGRISGGFCVLPTTHTVPQTTPESTIQTLEIHNASRNYITLQQTRE